MPFTPFHFGPGAALHAVAPRHVSFLAFCSANVLMDVEPLYFMLANQFPLHRFFHTYVGATVVLVVTAVLFTLLKKSKFLVSLLGRLHWKQPSILQVTIGAALGSYSHIFLDSLMHPDIRPVAPLSGTNVLLHAVSLSALHWACAAAGAVGLSIIGIRKVLRELDAV